MAGFQPLLESQLPTCAGDSRTLKVETPDASLLSAGSQSFWRKLSGSACSHGSPQLLSTQLSGGDV